MNFAYRSFIQVARQDFKRASRREHPMTLAVAWRAIFLVPALACGVSVHAQIVTTTPAIPDTKIVSPGGVDMRSGDYVDESTDLSIGPAAGGLTFVRVPKKFGVGFTSNWHFNVSRKNHGEPGAGFYYQFENKAIAKTFYSPQDLSYFVEVSFTDGFSD